MPERIAPRRLHRAPDERVSRFVELGNEIGGAAAIGMEDLHKPPMRLLHILWSTVGAKTENAQRFRLRHWARRRNARSQVLPAFRFPARAPRSCAEGRPRARRWIVRRAPLRADPCNRQRSPAAALSSSARRRRGRRGAIRRGPYRAKKASRTAASAKASVHFWLIERPSSNGKQSANKPTPPQRPACASRPRIASHEPVRDSGTPRRARTGLHQQWRSEDRIGHRLQSRSPLEISGQSEDLSQLLRPGPSSGRPIVWT